MYYIFRLKANVPFQAPIRGRVIVVDSTGEADGVDITPMAGGQELRTLPKRQKAFKCNVEFEAVVLRAAVDCTVSLFLSMTDVSLGFADGMLMKVDGDVTVTNDPDNPVPVVVQGADFTFTASNVSVSNNLQTITDFAPVDVGTVAAQLVGDPTQKRLRIRNAHASAVVAIGGAGVTLAKAAVQLMPGDVWVEEDAPGATWYAISDTAGAKIQIQGLK